MALSGWSKRFQITIDSSVVDSALTNFPVMVKISASTGKTSLDLTPVFDEIGSDSKKIAIATDADVECYVEIEKWDDVGEEAILWVKIPSVASGADTTLYLYYDSSHANNDAYVGVIGSTAGKAVWDANFMGVWHLSESGGPYLNSTSVSGIDMTTSAAPTRVSGEFMGYSQDFDGSQRCEIPDANELDFTTECTIELMLNIDSLAANRGVIMRQTNGYSIGVYSTGKVSWGKAGVDEVQSIATLSVDTDYHLCCTRVDGTNHDAIYLNGALDRSLVKADFAALATEIQVADHPSAASWEMDGGFDEIRMSDTDRSAAWIKATKNSNYDTLITYTDDPGFEDYIITVTPDPIAATGRIFAYVNASDPAEVVEAFILDLRAINQELEDLMLDLRATSSELLDLPMDLRATDGLVLLDVSLDLRAATAVTLIDLGLDLRVAGATPEFKCYVAQRLNSIKTDTGIL